MKRSEVLEVLKKAIDAYIEGQAGMIDSAELAEIALTHCESAGMVPPSVRAFVAPQGIEKFGWTEYLHRWEE